MRSQFAVYTAIVWVFVSVAVGLALFSLPQEQVQRLQITNPNRNVDGKTTIFPQGGNINPSESIKTSVKIEGTDPSENIDTVVEIAE